MKTISSIKQCELTRVNKAGRKKRAAGYVVGSGAAWCGAWYKNGYEAWAFNAYVHRRQNKI